MFGLLAAGRALATGRRPALSASGGQLDKAGPDRIAIPPNTFLNRDLAFHQTLDQGTELIARLPSLNRMFPPLYLRGSDADPSFPRYHDVLINTKELRVAWAAIAKPATPSALGTTVAAETRFTAWLIEQMRVAPNSPPGKAAIVNEAKAAGFSISERAFGRAWSRAVQEANVPAWSSPGRKSKRRIETST